MPTCRFKLSHKVFILPIFNLYIISLWILENSKRVWKPVQTIQSRLCILLANIWNQEKLYYLVKFIELVSGAIQNIARCFEPRIMAFFFFFLVILDPFHYTLHYDSPSLLPICLLLPSLQLHTVLVINIFPSFGSTWKTEPCHYCFFLFAMTLMLLQNSFYYWTGNLIEKIKQILDCIKKR